jgi:hypothetical protein
MEKPKLFMSNLKSESAQTPDAVRRMLLNWTADPRTPPRLEPLWAFRLIIRRTPFRP